MGDKHLSTQFDAELSGISNRVLEMGALVENQVASAVQAMAAGDVAAARGVLDREAEVDRLEVQVDAQLSAIIARRQPTARDLRLLIGISKATGNLERVGDEAARIARTVQRLMNNGLTSRLQSPVGDIAFEAELAAASLRKALDALVEACAVYGEGFSYDIRDGDLVHVEKQASGTQRRHLAKKAARRSRRPARG
jgi:phosphate transport system protein